LIIIQN